MKYLLVIAFAGLNYSSTKGQIPTNYTKKELIYGRKDGMALTMLMLTPKSTRNGKAIVSLVSGGWYTLEEWLPFYTKNANIYLQRGYTVFLVMPSGRPEFTIVDGIADAKRSVRFIRFHAAEYKIDPRHIGITGSSSGGQLSLSVATDDDHPDVNSKDPIDRVSGRVQAVACFYPPSDFLHWGNIEVDPKNKYILDQADVYSAFEFKEWDPKHKNFVLVTDQNKMVSIYKEISPIYQVSTDDPPVLIAHGTGDVVVPFSQSEKFIEKLKQANIACGLLVKEGGGHGGWNDENIYEKSFADWFDKYL
ncbi:MAG TPA: alpha/beta hydrolase [Puia sp.]|jgi:acetyl esterase/lipase